MPARKKTLRRHPPLLDRQRGAGAQSRLHFATAGDVEGDVRAADGAKARLQAIGYPAGDANARDIHSAAASGDKAVAAAGIVARRATQLSGDGAAVAIVRDRE